jgi:WD40 repeat protein
MWRVMRAAVFAVLGGIGLADANAQDLPGQEPQLVIEPGMHISRINAIAVDGGCTLLATASGDKTVRLWRLPEGDLLKTLRGPIGPGDEGKFNAVAMDAGGNWIAAGGWTRNKQHWIYIFETATRTVTTRLGPLPDVIQNLAVSRDGQYLAATLGGKLGLRVWQRTGKNLTAWSLIAEDKNYADQAHGVAFDATGTLYTVAFDGKLRRYSSGYTAKPVSVVTQGGKRPFTVAVHPSADRVAVGFVDTVAVEVYDAQSLARRFAADTTSVRSGNLAVVGWSSDGARLYGGGRYDKGPAMGILVWERGGEGSVRDIDGPLNTISQFLPCGDALAIGATDPLFGLLAADDRRTLWRGNVQADMRRKLGERFLLSADGMRVRFGLKEGDPSAKEGDSSSAPASMPAAYPPVEPVLFDLRTERLIDAPKPPEDLFAADVQSLPVTDWINTFNPKFQGKAISLLRDERARSLAIAPNKQQFILGAEWSLRAYDNNGKPQWKREVPGIVWGLNISRDGNVIVAAYSDGTIRWHRLKDGAELLALFVYGKDRRWVAWTPKGYYTASAGGEGLIGWHVNRGWSESADFFPAHRFRNRFYRPDVVQQVLITLDEDKAIAEADRRAGTAGQESDIRKLQPPVVEIVSHKDGDKFSEPNVTIQYSARSPIQENIAEVDVYLDGAKQTVTASVPTPGNEIVSVPLELPRNDVTIKIIAKAGGKESVARSIKLIWAGAKPATTRILGSKLLQPRLLALLIGVSTYANQEKLTANGLEKLNFAHLDAQNLGEALKNQEGKAFVEVLPKVLIDADAKTIRRDGLTWLKNTATKDDLTLIFLSGHGKTELNTFYFLSSDADPEDLSSTAIIGAEIVATIKGLPGRKLVVVDACRATVGITPEHRSPVVRMNDLVNDMTTGNVGVMFFGSSQAGQLSYENSNVKAGAFTHALIAGLSDKADLNKDGKVETWELESWLKIEVPKLTAGQPQDPVLYTFEPGLQYTIAHY